MGAHEPRVKISEVLAECDNLDETAQDYADIIPMSERLKIRAINNQTRMLARLGEELTAISWHTIATPDYS